MLFIKLLSCLRSDIAILDTLIVLLTYLLTLTTSAPSYLAENIAKVIHYYSSIHYWLTIRQRKQFKLAMIVFKCLHGLAPSYLADDCVLDSTVAGWSHLRSADTMKLSAQRTRTCDRRQSVCNICCCHLEQSTGRAQTDVVHPDIRTEAQNFLHQLDNVTATHLRTV